MTVTDPMEFVWRAEAVRVRIDEIASEARQVNLSLATPRDVAKLHALNDESTLLLRNLYEIRHEQIQWQLGEHPDQLAAKAARPWWRFWG